GARLPAVLRGALGPAPAALAGRLRPPPDGPGLAVAVPEAPWAALGFFLRPCPPFWPALGLGPSGWPLARPPLISRPGVKGSSPPARPPETRPRRLRRAPFWPFWPGVPNP